MSFFFFFFLPTPEFSPTEAAVGRYREPGRHICVVSLRTTATANVPVWLRRCTNSVTRPSGVCALRITTLWQGSKPEKKKKKTSPVSFTTPRRRLTAGNVCGDESTGSHTRSIFRLIMCKVFFFFLVKVTEEGATNIYYHYQDTCWLLSK